MSANRAVNGLCDLVDRLDGDSVGSPGEQPFTHAAFFVGVGTMGWQVRKGKMALENCPSCGKAYNRTTVGLCPTCWEREQRLFDVVSTYMYDHPNAEAPEVLEQTGIAHEDLEYLLKRGRLLGFEALVASVLRCYRCQEPTARGPYCRKCVALLKAEAQSAAAEEAGANERHKPKHEPRHPKHKDGMQVGENRADFWRSKARR